MPGHIKLVAKNWVADLMLEGTTYLSRPGPRDCFFLGLAQMAAVDGVVTNRERDLYQAFLDKPYNDRVSLTARRLTRQACCTSSAPFAW